MFQNLSDLLRLWYHESHRVFADRLVNEEDRTWFSSLLQEQMLSKFNAKFEEVVTSDPLLYADFMVTHQDVRPYCEIKDHVKVCNEAFHIIVL